MASRSSGCPTSAIPAGPGRAPGTTAANRRYLQSGHLNPNWTAITQAFGGCAGNLRDGQLLVLRSTVFRGVTALVEAAMFARRFAAKPLLRRRNGESMRLIRDTSRKGRKFPVSLINYGRSMTRLMTGRILFLASGRQAKCHRR
jgi:hypothetical protein